MEEFYGNRNSGKTEKDGDFQEEEIWAFGVNNRGKTEEEMQKSSSPVNIPADRYNINSKKSRRVRSKDGSFIASTSDDVCYGNVNNEENEEDYGEGMIPPHEYIARRFARNNQKNASFSMMEGVGRTLKGRDLSKVRNAILTKTGFLE